jgi:hypothetical protein
VKSLGVYAVLIAVLLLAIAAGWLAADWPQLCWQMGWCTADFPASAQ